VVRSDTPVRLARLSTSPFTDRLVAKFDLSILGWRGQARLEEAARAQAQAQPPRPASLSGPAASP
jgi:NAD+ kinase